jgi:hypothetical protein
MSGNKEKKAASSLLPLPQMEFIHQVCKQLIASAVYLKQFSRSESQIDAFLCVQAAGDDQRVICGTGRQQQ